jgi:hypothetical protein
VLQLLLASLVGLLLVERRLNDRHVRSQDDATGPIDFHPELIMRWDDETDDATASVCNRSTASNLRARARSESVLLRPRSYVR